MLKCNIYVLFIYISYIFYIINIFIIFITITIDLFLVYKYVNEIFFITINKIIDRNILNEYKIDNIIKNITRDPITALLLKNSNITDIQFETFMIIL